MNFLDYQAEARENTFRFVVLYALGVLGLGGVTALVAHFVFNLGGLPLEELPPQHWSIVATAAIVTWGIIFLGAAWRIGQLGRGGKVVAESLGGTLLSSGSTAGTDRRALNVVEEMALASGIPVPPVYVLRREKGINAFAAGWSQDDAVIGLTQGALEKLTRSELQGVIAHEFSHVVNHDTALNMRLLGVLHGIIALSIVGEFLLRMRGSGESKKSAAPFFLLGLTVWVFGSIGALVAQLIQARVSREREYLADASAVQFTRDPNGIAQALAKIALESSYLDSSFGREASHMLIAEPHEKRLFDLSSHPPLDKRIRRLLPSWDGRIESLASLPQPQATEANPIDASYSGPRKLDGLLPMQAAFAQAPLTRESSGVPPFAAPEDLLAQARETYGARLILLAAMLDDDARARAGQLTALSSMPETELRALPKIRARLDQVDPPERLPLINLALGSLAALSAPQAAHFAEQVSSARGGLLPLSHRAFCVCRLASRHLEAPRHTRSRTRLARAKLSPNQALGRLLGVVARRGNSSGEDAARAFAAGVHVVHPALRPHGLPSLRELELDRIDEALDVLVEEGQLTRVHIVEALVATAREDGLVRALEAELLSTFRVSLGVAKTGEV